MSDEPTPINNEKLLEDVKSIIDSESFVVSIQATIEKITPYISALDLMKKSLERAGYSQKVIEIMAFKLWETWLPNMV